MKKLLVILLLTAPAWGLDQYSGWCEAGNKKVSVQGMSSSTLVQQSYPNTGTPSTSCKITVYPHGSGTPANPIYSDDGITPLSNPFTVATNGSWQFFAAQGRYDILGTVGVTTIFTISNVSLLDPSDIIITGGTLDDVTITHSVINSTTIGLSSPATASFTTATASSFVGPLTGSASQLENHTWEIPGTIGSTTPNTATFTSIDCTKKLVGIRFASCFAGSDIGDSINLAIADLGSGGGQIYVAKGSSSFSTQINADDTTDIAIIGAGGISAGGNPSTTLTWTGTGTPITAQSIKGLIIQGCQWRWSNASFNGPYIDLGHSASAADSFGFVIAGNTFIKSGSGANIDRIIDLDKAHTGRVEGNFFYDYKYAIRGAASAGSYSNNIRVVGNHFDHAQTAHILNPQDTWLIESNTFEMSTSAGDPKVISVAAGVAPRNISFLHNLVDDTGVGATATRIDASEGYNWKVSNNTIGGLQATTTAIHFGDNVIGATATDNFFIGNAVGVSFGASVTGATVLGNQYQNTTVAISGTPSSSIQQGGDNQLTFLSSAQLNFTGPSIFTGDMTVTPVTRFRVIGRAESTLWGTVTNCSTSASPALCGSSAGGAVTVPAASTSVVVDTTAVTASSNIQLTRGDYLGSRLSVTCNTQPSLVVGTPRVTAITAGVSFTVAIDVAPTSNPLCLSYGIVN